MTGKSAFIEICDSASLWGKLYKPVREKLISKPGIRTVIFGSTNACDLVLNSLRAFEEKFPEKFNLIGLATDDPTDRNAKISIRKRIWSHYADNEKQLLFEKVLKNAMDLGISCYSGAVKTPYFRNILAKWNPELIIMCCFGQKIDQFIYSYPVYGMYNFHPSELKKKIGIGAEPFKDAIDKELTVSHMSIHQVTEDIDAGPVVGTSPPINICLSDGSYPSSILTLQEKIPSVCGWMSIELIQAILVQMENGKTGPVHCVNYNQKFPELLKLKLMEPALDDIDADYYLSPHPILNNSKEDGKY